MNVFPRIYLEGFPEILNKIKKKQVCQIIKKLYLLVIFIMTLFLNFGLQFKKILEQN